MCLGGGQLGQLGEVLVGEPVEEEAEGCFLLSGEELLEEPRLLLTGEDEEGIGEAVYQLPEALEVVGLQPVVEELVLAQVAAGGVRCPVRRRPHQCR
jgi:hypothetical protein